MAIPKYSCLGISSHSCIFRTTDASQCNTHLLSNSLYFSQNSLWNYIWLVLVKTWEMDLSFFPNLRWGYTYINSSRSLKVHSQLFLPNLYTIPKNAKEIGKMDWKHLPEKKKKKRLHLWTNVFWWRIAKSVPPLYSQCSCCSVSHHPKN